MKHIFRDAIRNTKTIGRVLCVILIATIVLTYAKIDAYANLGSSKWDALFARDITDGVNKVGRVVWSDVNAEYKGHTSIAGNTSELVRYTNTEFSSECYVRYKNSVLYGDKVYDLVIYPRKVFDGVWAGLGRQKQPYMYHTGNDEKAYAEYKVVISEPGDTIKPVDIDMGLAFCDLDKGEHVAFDFDFEEIYVGATVGKFRYGEHLEGPEVPNHPYDKEKSYTGIRYIGTKASNDYKTALSDAAVLIRVNIPETGVVIKSGTFFTNGLKTTFSSDKLDDAIDNNYIIAFNGNGGSGNLPRALIEDGDSASVVMGNIQSNVPTRDHYTFKGWSAIEEFNDKRVAYGPDYGGSEARDGTKATDTGSSWSFEKYCNEAGGSSSDINDKFLLLYAQWEEITYSITYNGNGNTGGSTASQIKNHDTAISLQNNGFTRTGYTFKNWNTESDGTGTSYSEGANYNTNADLTLYAQWEIITYSITYNGNGNIDGSTASQTKNYGTAINLQNNGFAKTGYKFKSWNTASDGTGTSYAEGASYTANADLTLYAQWEIITYPITYNGNGNTGGSTASQTKDYFTAINLQNNGFTKTGYKFKNWNTSK